MPRSSASGRTYMQAARKKRSASPSSAAPAARRTRATTAADDPVSEDACCQICKQRGEDADPTIIMCDACNLGFHHMCLTPPLVSPPSLTYWFCARCRDTVIDEVGCSNQAAHACAHHIEFAEAASVVQLMCNHVCVWQQTTICRSCLLAASSHCRHVMHAPCCRRSSSAGRLQLRCLCQRPSCKA